MIEMSNEWEEASRGGGYRYQRRYNQLAQHCSGMTCPAGSNGTVVDETSGTIVMPGSLFDLGGTYVLQTNDDLVLQRQPAP